MILLLLTDTARRVNRSVENIWSACTLYVFVILTDLLHVLTLIETETVWNWLCYVWSSGSSVFMSVFCLYTFSWDQQSQYGQPYTSVCSFYSVLCFVSSHM